MVVHNGIVTNSAAVKQVLQNRGYRFESETDTEVVAVLMKYVHEQQKDDPFPAVVKTVLQELQGSFAFVIKSTHYPNEIVTARRGSPLLIGVKTDKKLKVDFVDVEFSGQETDAKPVDGCKWSPEEAKCLALMNGYSGIRSARFLPCPSSPQDLTQAVAQFHV